MRIEIQVLYTESWQPMADIVSPTAEAYCTKHGYKLTVKKYPEPYYPTFGYNKFKEIDYSFNEGGVDVIMSMDLDALITNHNITIESFLDDNNDFYICEDVNGVNAGVFIIKRSQWAGRFIDYVLSMEGKLSMHCEQNAIENYLWEVSTYKTKIVKHPAFNSYDYSLYEFPNIRKREQGHWHEGDFILHTPGAPMQLRIETLKNAKIVR